MGSYGPEKGTILRCSYTLHHYKGVLEEAIPQWRSLPRPMIIFSPGAPRNPFLELGLTKIVDIYHT